MTLAAPDVDAIRLALDRAESILVLTHVSPDGDAIASLTATGLALGQLGKSFTLCCDDGVPSRYLFLALSDQVLQEPIAGTIYDLVIALDSGDTQRLGQAYANLTEPFPPVVNIDHHVTNTYFGEVNLIVPEANATAEILTSLLPAVGVTLTADLAMCLLTGLVTDTLGFRTAGVTAHTLRAASVLIEAGADLYTVTTNGLSLKQLSTIMIWKQGLSNLRVEDGLLWTSISNKERQEVGHETDGTEGLGNLLADVYQAAFSVVLLELDDHLVSVSFRCRPPFSVAELAQVLGGGGHQLAAGCTLRGSLADVERKVIAQCRQSVREQRAALKPQQRNAEHG